MRPNVFLSIVVALAAGAPGVGAAAEVSRSVTVDASASEVWSLVGPFCAISNWYPGIDSCVEQTVDGAAHRRLLTGDGGEFLEKLMGHDDATMSYGYAIIEGPLPVKDYEAVFSVSETNGKADVTWSSRFEPDGVSEEEATDVIGGVYEAGLDAVKNRFPM